MAAPVLWAPGIFWFFLLENPHSHKIPPFGGGCLGFLGRGGSANFVFVGVGIFFSRDRGSRLMYLDPFFGVKEQLTWALTLLNGKGTSAWKKKPFCDLQKDHPKMVSDLLELCCLAVNGLPEFRFAGLAQHALPHALLYPLCCLPFAISFNIHPPRFIRVSCALQSALM